MAATIPLPGETGAPPRAPARARRERCATRRCLCRAVGASALAAVLAGLAGGSAADSIPRVAAADYQRVNEGVVHGHVLPRYDRLAAASAGLEEAARALCDAPGAAALDGARRAYHRSMDAWMGIQHIGFGPVAAESRVYRLYFWPQGRRKIAKAVDAVVAARDASALAPARFREASAAVQGLPAIEHLLFRKGESLAAGDAAGRFACRVAAAIAANVRDIAEGVRREWHESAGGAPPFARVLLDLDSKNPFFRTPKDTTFALFSSFHAALDALAEVKLRPVVGTGADGARPRLAESRPSRRSSRNIAVTIEAVRALYEGEGGPGLGDIVARLGRDPELDPLMHKAFAATLRTARRVGMPVEDAVADPGFRPRVEKLLTQIAALRQLARKRVGEALGLVVGFNSLDGD